MGFADAGAKGVEVGRVELLQVDRSGLEWCDEQPFSEGLVLKASIEDGSQVCGLNPQGFVYLLFLKSQLDSRTRNGKLYLVEQYEVLSLRTLCRSSSPNHI